MGDSNFPTNAKPLLITEPEGKAIRSRLVQIEHSSQHGTRTRNATHIELFDKIEIGRLARTRHDELEVGDKGDLDLDMGIFLCGRNTKNIKVFHSSEERPSCKKCIKIANRLIRKGLDIFMVSEENWKLLQEAFFKHEAENMMKGAGIESHEDLKEFLDNNMPSYTRDMFDLYKK